MCEHHIRRLGDFALVYATDRIGYLLIRIPQVDSPCLSTYSGLPWDRFFQCPVHFINAWAVTESGKSMPVIFGKTKAFNIQQLPGGDVKKIIGCLGYILQRTDRYACYDFASPVNETTGKASARFCEPPFTNGHPTAWANVASIMPKAAVAGL